MGRLRGVAEISLAGDDNRAGSHEIFGRRRAEGIGDGVVRVTTAEYGPRLLAVSLARTR